ncbi:MAG: hypothetical protein LBL17_02335 [Coxiellaceae bacterium]|jgi:methionyl-tRNA formyltransferase|nr:hypothetical protein [Coxiellaceae bacterium]
MNISILITDPTHPINPLLEEWRNIMIKRGHNVSIYHKKSECLAGGGGGDILFLISCSSIIGVNDRKRFNVSLVIHASDLPKGRGWSPHIWSILSGENVIHVCLLEAADAVDTGNIWLRDKFYLEGHELLPEINQKLFAVELKLMTRAVNEFDNIIPIPQNDIFREEEYRKRRTPKDSKLDPYKSIASQFNLLRVADNERYPVFFEYMNKIYVLKIEKVII